MCISEAWEQCQEEHVAARVTCNEHMKLYVVWSAKVARMGGHHRRCEQTVQNIVSGADQSIFYECTYLVYLDMLFVHNMMNP